MDPRSRHDLKTFPLAWVLLILTAMMSALSPTHARDIDRVGSRLQEEKAQADYDKKLQQEFVSKVNWSRTLSQAQELSKERVVPIVAYFTVSSAPSVPCDRVESGLWCSDDWVTLSKQCVPYLHVTSGLASEPDKGLFARYKVQRHPMVLFLDAEGVELFRFSPFQPLAERGLTQGVGDAALLVKGRHMAGGGKIDGKRGDRQRGRAIVLIVSVLRQGKEVDARALKSAIRVLSKKPAPEESDLLARAVTRLAEIPFLEVRRLFEEERDQARAAQNLPAVQQASEDAQERCYLLFKKGTRLPSESQYYFEYWAWTTEGAVAARDKKLATQALELLLQSPSAQGKRIDDLKQRVEEL